MIPFVFPSLHSNVYGRKETDFGQTLVTAHTDVVVWRLTDLLGPAHLGKERPSERMFVEAECPGISPMFEQNHRHHQRQ